MPCQADHGRGSAKGRQAQHQVPLQLLQPHSQGTEQQAGGRQEPWNACFNGELERNGVGAQGGVTGLLIERIDQVEGAVAGANANPWPRLDHLQRSQPNVDAEVVGAVAPAGQHAGEANAQRLHLDGRQHQRHHHGGDHQRWQQFSPQWPQPAGLPQQQQ